MKKNYSIAISGVMYNQLKNHLFPGDGKEAVAIALCGRHEFHNERKLLFHKLILIPYQDCEIREPDFIKWSTALLQPHLSEAAKKGWGVVKIHSHPGGFPEFSETDNKSDRELFDSVYGWMDNDNVHGSMVMLPNGKMFGRVILPDLSFVSVNKILIAGDNVKIWFKENGNIPKEEFNKRTSQAFGQGTTQLLRKLKVGVVGCSGTGSPTIEQLVRLGIGEIVLIDPDKVEEKNLNRILNTTMQDAKDRRYKVSVLAAQIEKIGIGTKVIAFNQNIFDNREILDHLATCDFIFGCVDSIDGRFLLNQLATFYLIPYIDMGVKLIADGKGGVDQICGSVHYLEPGGSSLKTRGVFSSEELRAAGLARTNPSEFNELKKSGYIVNINENSPAVISINMFASSMAINEFLARIHGFRFDSNEEFAITRFSLTDSYMQREPDGLPDEYLRRYVGRGKMKPMLNLPELD